MKRLLALSLLLSAVTGLAAPVTPGNLLIYRVGDGSAALSTAATPVFLDEYSPLGSLVQTFALPSSGATALTAVGNATTEGIMSLSQDGSLVLFTGYRKNAGGTSPASDAPGTTPRVIGTFSPSLGLFDTSISLTDANGTIRSATSTDGSSLFYVGTSAGVRYVASPGPSSTSVVVDSRNSRQALLRDNRLFVSNGSTSLTPKVQDYGVLPTGPVASNAVVVLTTADAVNGIAFFDLDAGVAGVDTLYALSTVEGRLRKYTFDGSAWNASGFLSTTAQNLNGLAVGGAVNLFLTTGSSLLSVTDTSGYGGTLSGTPTTLATAGANTAFRGIVQVVPEPASMALLAIGAALLMRRWAR